MRSERGEDSSDLARWGLLAVWAGMVFLTGLVGVHASTTGSRRALILVVIVVGSLALIGFFAAHVSLLYGVAFATIPMVKLIIPGLTVPLNEVLLLIALLVALIQNRKERVPVATFAKVATASLVGLFLLSAVLHQSFGLDTSKRIGHIALWCGLILALATGLIPRKIIQMGALIGFSVSCFVGVVWMALGDAPDGYHGRLTGLFGDPNVAGFSILTLGCLSIEIVPKGWRRNTTIFLLAIPFVLTQSRGALAAMFFCLMWWFLGRRLRPATGLALLSSTSVLVSLIPAALQQAGVFSSRAGSDILRSTILSSSWSAAIRGFWIGNGTGGNLLDIYGQYRFYFHNSYLALVSEGGIISAIVVVSFLLTVFIQLVALPQRDIRLEMALVGVAVCALHLGEVLLDLTSAIAIGLSLKRVAQARSVAPQPDSSFQNRTFLPAASR